MLRSNFEKKILTDPQPYAKRKSLKMQRRLKRSVIEAYSHGLLPGSIVEMVFEAAELKEV